MRLNCSPENLLQLAGPVLDKHSQIGDIPSTGIEGNFLQEAPECRPGHPHTGVGELTLARLAYRRRLVLEQTVFETARASPTLFLASANSAKFLGARHPTVFASSCKNLQKCEVIMIP